MRTRSSLHGYSSFGCRPNKDSDREGGLGSSCDSAPIDGDSPLLEIEGLSVAFTSYEAGESFFTAPRVEVPVLDGLSLEVGVGEFVAVVGASGSGKTVLLDSIMGFFSANAVVHGEIRFDGVTCDASMLRSLRGHGVSMVPQDISWLDPTMTVGEQVVGLPRGASRAERRVDRERRRARAHELLEEYGLDGRVAELYPHELSGGMARRVLLACALMEEPRLLIADEPTVGLDRRLALHALADLRAYADGGGAVLAVTHDLGLAVKMADRIAVFSEGRVVEQVPSDLFCGKDVALPRFARSMWDALPEHAFWGAPIESVGVPASGVAACPGRVERGPFALPGSDAVQVEAAGCECLTARDVRFAHRCGRGAVSGVSLSVAPGERVALIGPSGCGKTTLCRILAGHVPPSAGYVVMLGDDGCSRVEGRCGRAHPVQLVWQHPREAFDPYVRLETSLSEAAGAYRLDDSRDTALMLRLGVPRSWLGRYPAELSGGELMRCGILRAFLANPRYVIADEITASLDAVSQARIWRVVVDICEERGIGLLFTTHDRALAMRIATRVIAMECGRLM